MEILKRINYRKLAVLLIAVLTLSMLTACGGSDEDSEESSQVGTWAAVEESGVLKVGTEGTYSPYSYHDDSDNLVGYDVELLRAVGEKLGVEVEFTESKWDGLIAGLDAGQYDIVADQITITDERKEKYLFSDPYTYVYGVVITRADYDEISSFEDLDGKNVSLTSSSNWAQLSESYGASIVPTNGFSESIQLVLENRADATVNDNVTYLDYKNQQPDVNVKVAAEATEINESAILIRQGDEELQTRINEALAELREEGTISELSVKYFGEDISQPE